MDSSLNAEETKKKEKNKDFLWPQEARSWLDETGFKTEDNKGDKCWDGRTCCMKET